MRGDLVTISYHSLNYSWVRSCGIDWAFAEIVASDEKRRMKTKLLKYIEKLVGIFVWPVIVCQSNYVILDTIVYVIIVSDSPKKRAWVGKRGCSGWSCVGITRAILILTCRVSTIVLGRTAIAL